MDLFFNIAATSLSFTQVANIKQITHVPTPQPAPGSTIDFSSASEPQKDRRSGNLDSLGQGNLL
ncbi:hypothetical protein K0P33_26635 [Pseudomonas sp. ArH3a]|uniref:hypothetical protein n=1 Tax=Pseudomonas sp. ArH3a TaxID=2862945 RepID=UPI001F57074F|nr:hypothetical protein [Pseudomonas sp. ArH3a]UNM19049.1 hypothetical protein K0P33_26635 [Pseudomonas sp. ArH3a]